MSEERKIGPRQPRSTAFRLFVAGAYLVGFGLIVATISAFFDNEWFLCFGMFHAAVGVYLWRIAYGKSCGEPFPYWPTMTT
jgi:hypothetical protein